MSPESNAPHTVQLSDRVQSIGLALSQWIQLEEQLTALLAHVANTALSTARAIMFSATNCMAERITMLRNVAIAQSYSDWHLIQLSRTLSRIEDVDKIRRNIFEAPVLPMAGPPGTTGTSALDRIRDADLHELMGKIVSADTGIRDLLGSLPKGQLPPGCSLHQAPDRTQGGAQRAFD
jgi:hypothetical protein